MPQSPQLDNAHPSKSLLPAVKGLPANTHLTAYLGGHFSSFHPAQGVGYLLFRKPLLHCLPSSIWLVPLRDSNLNSGGVFRGKVTLCACFSKRTDALFELSDAVITGGPQPSPVHLSLQHRYRRGWGSLYAALRHRRIDPEHLRTTLSNHPLDPDCRPVYAVDVSVWSRCDAEASPERGFYYHPSRHSAGQPIVAGWAYQRVAQLGFSRTSWIAPLDVRRVHPTENAYEAAVQQIQSLLDNRRATLPACASSHSSNQVPVQVPVFVFDAGYEPNQLAEELGNSNSHASILVRLRSGRCFYGDPPSPD